MKSALEIPTVYRYWLRPGGIKGTTKLSGSSLARVFPFRDFLRAGRLDPPGTCAWLFLVATTLATSGRVYRHASHSPACPCPGGSWFPIQSPPLLLYHATPFSIHKFLKYLFPLRGLLWLWVWCFLCTPAKTHSTTAPIKFDVFDEFSERLGFKRAVFDKSSVIIYESQE